MKNKALAIIFISIIFSTYPQATQASNSSLADYNNDNVVNIFDYNILVSNFGNPYTIFDYNNLIYDYDINLSNIGFNELFTLSHLSHTKQEHYQKYEEICLSVPDAHKCPQNMPPNSIMSSSTLIQKINSPVSGPIIRDIIPLKVLEPSPGEYPLENELLSVLKTYNQNSVDLVLSFTHPLPSWIEQQTTNEEKIESISQVIASFIARVSESSLDPNWMSSHLTIEPLSEVNVIFGVEDAVKLDKKVQAKLDENNAIYKKLISSSIISGSKEQFVKWFEEYYQLGGTAIPNVHLYVNEEIDEGSFEKFFLRLENVITELNSISPTGRIIVGEIGIPSAHKTVTPNERERFIHTLSSSKAIQSTEKAIIWRIWRDWLAIDCTLETCDPLTASETTFGFIKFHDKKVEDQFQRYFINH